MAVRLTVAVAVLVCGVWGYQACIDDPETDLCDKVENWKLDADVDGAVRARAPLVPALLLSVVFGGRNALPVLPLIGFLWFADAATSENLKCGGVKTLFQNANCCDNEDKAFTHEMIAKQQNKMFTNNPCEDAKPLAGFQDSACVVDGVIKTVEQAGANITVGFQGELDVLTEPINSSYLEAGLCPVNVHWHLGTEHYSKGQFDEFGDGPEVHAQDDPFGEEDSRRLATARLGFRCHHYDKDDPKFTTEYKWQHCENMHVGETYEVHWPHSRGGACGTPWQYQTPFYDGVFCNATRATTPSTQESIGVQGQIFTIVNDEEYYYPNLFLGMINEGEFGKKMTYYTGSTTGTKRNNQICSKYAPITWQVDRTCHLISASSFDKMCADMLQQADDRMVRDVHAHGSRILVDSRFVADNFEFKNYRRL